MLAYAADRRAGFRRRSPAALVLIVAGHAAVVALVLNAKTIVDRHRAPSIVLIDPSVPPPPANPTRDHPKTVLSPVDRQLVVPNHDLVVPRDPVTTSPVDPMGGSGTIPLAPYVPPVPTLHFAARMITPADVIDPPYPEAKRRLEEEATLRLALAIDAGGRVTAVDPVGAADPVFLAAARRHILVHWRYQPAREGDRAVASSMTVTLRFRLEE